MYKHILVPIDLAETGLAKPAIDTAVMMARQQPDAIIRIVNVLPLTPVMQIRPPSGMRTFTSLRLFSYASTPLVRSEHD